MAVAGLGSESVGAELIDLGLQKAALMYRIVHLAAALDASDEWRIAGAPTAAHWIAERLDFEVSTAREWVRIGKALAALPCIDEAFVEQQVSYSKVRMLTRIATPDNEIELCELAMKFAAGELRTELAKWLTRNEDQAETDGRQHEQRGTRWHTEPDGMLDGRFRLPAADGGRVTAAIDAEMMRGRDASAGARPTLAQQRADALVRLLTEGGSTVEAELVVHVRGDGCSLDDGTPITDSAVGKMLPSSFVRALIHDADGAPINASGRQRFPTLRQRRVVKERDRNCIDCGGSLFLEFDHEPPFEESHHTLVDELQLRCSGCHRKRHKKAA